MTHVTNDDSHLKSRHWICTLNNYTEAELAKCITFGNDKAQYACIGKEVGKTGTPHLQIYFQMKTAYSGQTIKNQTSKRLWTGKGDNFGDKGGNPQRLRKYCQKEGDYMEFGEFKDTVAAKAKGQRAGASAGGAATKAMWKSLDDDIEAGYKEKEIKVKYPHLYYKHHTGIAKGISITNKIPPRKEKTCVHVYIGPPGCGKTSKAKELAGQSGYWYDSPNRIWWSGYDGTSAVVMDDFHGDYPFKNWKLLTDQYPHQVPVHQGMLNFNPKMIIITANEMPGTWWKQEVLQTHGYAALLRRINVLQVWDEAKKDFVFTDLQDRCWNMGCVCDPKFAETAPTPIILSEEDEPEPEPLQRQTATLDLSDSSFLAPPKRVLSVPLSPPPLPKKRKVQKDPQDKNVGQLTEKLNEMYPDPFEVDTLSSEDDPIDSFDDSCSSGSDSMSDDLSEEF